jgi:predicted Fe-Mo cluster-binding NifX family protein
MIVAIPEHQGRLAPVFDCCRKIVVVRHEPDGDQIVAEEDWSQLDRRFRASRLKELNIDALICGGISGWMEEQVRLFNINLYPWLSGEVDQILRALREGDLSDPCYAMPGAARCCGFREDPRAPGRGLGKKASGRTGPAARRKRGRKKNDQ